MTTQNASNSFFDLHITGLGYLNRIREVTPKRGDAFWACDIAALNGPTDDVSYTRFDCRISGREAESLVRRCQQAVDMGKKVLIGFKLGDLWTDTFTYQKGDRQGQTGVSLKARLLFISWIKVNGEMVYQAPRNDDQQQEQSVQKAPQEQPVQTPAQTVPQQAPTQQPAQQPVTQMATVGGSAAEFDAAIPS